MEGDKAHTQTKMQFGYTSDTWNVQNFKPGCSFQPLPPEGEWLIETLLSRGVLSSHQRPDSLIINVYQRGDSIKPHIDHPQYERPFCTVSLSSSAQMGLGSKIPIRSMGNFDSPYEVTLPARSVMVLDGNGANIARHCIPSVAEYRVSWTLRRMPVWVREHLHASEVTSSNNPSSVTCSSQEPNQAEEAEPSRSVFVSKLTRKTTKIEVFDLFSSFGSLRQVIRFHGKDSAIVEFEHEEDCERCTETQPAPSLNGMQLQVKSCRGWRQPSTKT